MNKKNTLTFLSIVALLTVGGFSLDKEDTVYAKDRTDFHTVEKGENLYRIALNNGFSVDEVALYNHIDKKETIHPKDKIYLPDKSETKEVTAVKEEPKVKPEPVVEVKEEKSTYGNGLLDWQFSILCAVVQQESIGLTSVEQLPSNAYDSALAVMTSITNRVDANSYYGSDVYGVISAPSQYESFGAKHYEKHLGKILDVTKQAVNDGLKGKKSHNYLNFRSKSYADAYGFAGVNIGGNVYFND